MIFEDGVDEKKVDNLYDRERLLYLMKLYKIK